jgi:hypothetical protein
LKKTRKLKSGNNDRKSCDEKWKSGRERRSEEERRLAVQRTNQKSDGQMTRLSGPLRLWKSTWVRKIQGIAPLVPILTLRSYTFAPFILPFALSFLPPSRQREKERSHAACSDERDTKEREEDRVIERKTRTKHEILIDLRETEGN